MERLYVRVMYVTLSDAWGCVGHISRSMAVDMTIRGIQEAQRWNVRAIAALRPSGALGWAIVWGTAAAHRYAVSITHVDTGALRASQRMAVSGAQGRIYLDASARNPRTGQRTAAYGPVEEARGGSHAFYRRTVAEAGDAIAKGMAQRVVSEVV